MNRASRRFLLGLLMLLPLVAQRPAYASAPQKEGPVASAFMVFDPFTVSVVERRRMTGLLVLEITLQIPQAEAREKAEEIKPRIRDGFVRALMQFGATRAHTDRPPDIERIAATLQAMTDQYLSPGQAHILVTQALLRPMN